MTVIEYYGLDGVPRGKWTYVGYTSLFFIFFFVCTWLVLAFKKYSSR